MKRFHDEDPFDNNEAFIECGTNNKDNMENSVIRKTNGNNIFNNQERMTITFEFEIGSDIIKTKNNGNRISEKKDMSIDKDEKTIQVLINGVGGMIMGMTTNWFQIVFKIIII